MDEKTISGFSKLSKRGKIRWIVEHFFKDPEGVMRELKSYWLENEEQQNILDGFSENTISNYPLPYGVAPNFVINGKTYCIPMVIEESSVVAAASSAAKFWMTRGGFQTKVLGSEKVGQLHIYWDGSFEEFQRHIEQIEHLFRKGTESITENMRARGGGLSRIELVPFPEEDNYFQIRMYFETCDSMGANFINSVLEECADILDQYSDDTEAFAPAGRPLEVVMAILSNYTPTCLVRAEVSCPVSELGSFSKNMSAGEFASRFNRAVRIAQIDPYRAVTHNKGIYNGVDAVVISTGNDFRAVEACGHAYAARNGQYKSLSNCRIEDDEFRFWLYLPISVGTVGGTTSLHPIARRSMELLGHPSAHELMQIIAAAGLAQNFAALRSLVTTGIQHGHMKMHLKNILNHFDANPEEEHAAMNYFKDKVVSFKGVREFLNLYREGRVEV